MKRVKVHHAGNQYHKVMVMALALNVQVRPAKLEAAMKNSVAKLGYGSWRSIVVADKIHRTNDYRSPYKYTVSFSSDSLDGHCISTKVIEEVAEQIEAEVEEALRLKERFSMLVEEPALPV